MAELRIRTARHTLRVAAPPRRVYQHIADVSRWPQIFEPTVHVEHLGTSGAIERVRQWELIGNEVRARESHRELNPRRLQVRFRLDATARPAASMGGLWMVVPKPTGSLIVLDHHFRVVDDDPAGIERLEDVVSRTGAARIAALGAVAELGPDFDTCRLSISDTVDIAGADPRDVYNFLARSQNYAASGSRVCFPGTQIVYKDAAPPPAVRVHTGEFAVTALPGLVRATAAHTVLLRDQSTMDPLRRELSEESLAALGGAKEYAQARRPIGVGATQR
jgi:aromatase